MGKKPNSAQRKRAIKQLAGVRRKNKTPLKKECDRLWSRVILKRDGNTCQSCKRPGNNPHHIFSKKYIATRYDISNGITLCWACHMHKAHSDYESFRDFIIKVRGKPSFEQLKNRALVGAKPDLYFTKIILQQMLDEI